MKNLLNILILSIIGLSTLFSQSKSIYLDCVCKIEYKAKGDSYEGKPYQGIRIFGYSDGQKTDLLKDYEGVEFKDVWYTEKYIIIKGDLYTKDRFVNYVSDEDISNCLKGGSGEGGGGTGPQGPAGPAGADGTVDQSVIDSIKQCAIDSAIGALGDSLAVLEFPTDGVTTDFDTLNNNYVITVTIPGQPPITYQAPIVSGGPECDLVTPADIQGYVDAVTNDTVTVKTYLDTDGNICHRDTVCKPQPLEYTISVIGDSWADSTCTTKIYDSNDLDMTCANGFYVTDSITVNSAPAGNMPTVFQMANGQIYFTPDPCNAAYTVSVYSVYVCDIDGDGVQDTSNQQIDVITHIPQPIGDIRITKVNNTSDNQFTSGDEFTWTFVLNNVGDGNVLDPIVTDPFPACVTYVTDDSGVTPTATGNSYEWDFAGTTIAPLSSISFDVDVSTDNCPAGIEYLSNIAQVTADDGNGGETSDSDDDVLNETQIAESRVTATDPDHTTGISVLEFTHTKQPSGALIPPSQCENHLVTVELIEAGIPTYSVLEGNTCNDISTYTVVSGFDLTPYLSGSTANGGSVQFDKKAWAQIEGWEYAATGLSEQNGNQYITNTSDLDARTFAQTVRFYTVVGGGNPPTATCPIPSSNSDNFADICKILDVWTGGHSFFFEDDMNLTNGQCLLNLLGRTNYTNEYEENLTAFTQADININQNNSVVQNNLGTMINSGNAATFVQYGVTYDCGIDDNGWTTFDFSTTKNHGLTGRSFTVGNDNSSNGSEALDYIFIRSSGNATTTGLQSCDRVRVVSVYQTRFRDVNPSTYLHGTTNITSSATHGGWASKVPNFDETNDGILQSPVGFPNQIYFVTTQQLYKTRLELDLVAPDSTIFTIFSEWDDEANYKW